MNTYRVEAHVGTVYATVAAKSEDDAVDKAIERWAAEGWEIFTAATFDIQEYAHD